MIPIAITKSELEALAFTHATQEEMAAYFGCHRETLADRIKEYYDMNFSEFLDVHCKKSLISLRRVGWKKALKGEDAQLARHQDKYLGFATKVENTYQGPDGGPIKSESKITLSKMSDDDFNAACKEIGLPDQVFKK